MYAIPQHGEIIANPRHVEDAEVLVYLDNASTSEKPDAAISRRPVFG